MIVTAPRHVGVCTKYVLASSNNCQSGSRSITVVDAAKADQNRTRATMVGGERSHRCAIPAPEISTFITSSGSYLLKQDISAKALPL